MSNVNAPLATRRYFDITDQVRQPHVINNKLIGAQSAETSSKEDGTIVGGDSAYAAQRSHLFARCENWRSQRVQVTNCAGIWQDPHSLLYGRRQSPPVSDNATEWSLHILLGVKTYLCPNIRSSTVKSMASTRCLWALGRHIGKSRNLLRFSLNMNSPHSFERHIK